MKKKRFLPAVLGVGIVALAVLFVLARLAVQMQSPPPDHLGVRGGRLAPCPETPNCVSTQAAPADGVHYIQPIAIDGAGDREGVYRNLVAVLEGMPRSRIVTREPDYIHAEFRSLTWRFVDDVEFYFDGEAGLIHSRSAARLGYGDFEVNRNRYEEIRRALAP